MKKWSYVEGIYDTEDKFGFGNPKPTVRYTVLNNEYKTTSRLCQNYIPRNGKKVGIFYDPHNPENIIIDSFIQRGDLFILLGIIFLMPPILVFLSSFFSLPI